jgi:hypothetical protein
MTWHASDGMNHTSQVFPRAANDPIGGPATTYTHQFRHSLAISSNTSQVCRNGLLPRGPPPPLPRLRRPARPPLRLSAACFPLRSPPSLHRPLAATASSASASRADSRSAQVGGPLLLRRCRCRCRRWGVVPVGTGGCVGGPPPGWRGVRGGAGEGPPRVAAPRGFGSNSPPNLIPFLVLLCFVF